MRLLFPNCPNEKAKSKRPLAWSLAITGVLFRLILLSRKGFPEERVDNRRVASGT